MTIPADNTLSVAVVEAIQKGDLAALQRLLELHPGLATATIGDPKGCQGISRSLLHVATDWPGHFPNGPMIVAALIKAGAEVNARFTGPHAETPLHWAASSDDVAILDALLDAGADIEAPGAVIGGGTPLADAVGFGQWQAARRLVERGGRTTLAQAAALGLLERVASEFTGTTCPAASEINRALWYACHGGQRRAAEYLLARGGDPNWIPPWERRTALDTASRSRADELVAWLRGQGAKSALEIT